MWPTPFNRLYSPCFIQVREKLCFDISRKARNLVPSYRTRLECYLMFIFSPFHIISITFLGPSGSNHFKWSSQRDFVIVNICQQTMVLQQGRVQSIPYCTQMKHSICGQNSHGLSQPILVSNILYR